MTDYPLMGVVRVTVFKFCLQSYLWNWHSSWVLNGSWKCVTSVTETILCIWNVLVYYWKLSVCLSVCVSWVRCVSTDVQWIVVCSEMMEMWQSMMRETRVQRAECECLHCLAFTESTLINKHIVSSLAFVLCETVLPPGECLWINEFCITTAVIFHEPRQWQV